ncbi:30S ribosomal protein S6 [bacterium]|nr:30S ribosomal protein S6 [bacterium]
MKRTYELVVITPPHLETDEREALLEKIRGYISSSNGKIIGEEDWGLRKFCYPIKRSDSGYYTLFVFDGKETSPKRIDESLRLNENVLRHLIVHREKPYSPSPMAPKPEEPDEEAEES